jgi:hypothetical protein
MGLDVQWMSVFADVPAAALDRELAFWERISASRRGPAEGDDDEFVPLVPATGDRVLWLQRVDRVVGGWHLDLHVPDVDVAVRQARACGATLVRPADGIATLESPAGLAFCVIRESRPSRRRPGPVSWPAGHRSLIDQLCSDVPEPAFDHECDFWAELTGWRRLPHDGPEFVRLATPARLPLRLLFQRLGAEDAGGARAHLDMPSDDVPAEADRHRSSGAVVVRVAPHWTTLRDPAGLTYCITDRTPDAGPT